ncbi:sulfatase [Rubritalea spongiae]|uniref:Sulfatase n=1 Tax=Rubritalea spongiae TaxID=430797 RepID=A0ABW5E354_9BACT
MKILTLLSALALSLIASAAKQPNFIVIFTDDQGYGDLACFGGTSLSTPHIDQMAKEGARLTSFYVAAPVCTPSRASLMTGCYPQRIDMGTGSKFPVLLAGDAKGLNPEERTIAEVLKSAGYKTAMFGKWHLGDQPEFLPTRQGFDEFFGIPYSHDIHPFHPSQKKFKFPPLPLLEGEKVIELDPDADYLTKRFTDRAVEFIEKNKDEPFFLYLPHPLPHVPLHASPPFLQDTPKKLTEALSKEKGIDYKLREKLFKECIAEIDWSVGQILDTLKAQGIDDNTLVIFSSDNGAGRYATNPSTHNHSGPLTGMKGSTFEGGMRVPTVIRWPGTIPAGKDNDALMTTMDLLPTFAHLAGASVPQDRVIDGLDVSSVLIQHTESPHKVFFYHKVNDLQAVRSGKWKLHVPTKSRNKKGKETISKPALYNLETDIGETQNLIDQHPEIAQRLKNYITEFQTELATNSRPAATVKNPKILTK